MDIASTTAISSNRTRRKRIAELTSGIGALVLGVGLGVVLGGRLAGLGLWAIIVGAVVHAWGMYDKLAGGALFLSGRLLWLV